MTNKMRVLRHELSFRFFRVSSATLGALSLVTLLFALVRSANSASAEGPSPVLLAVNQGEGTLGIVDPRAGEQ
ncbi:MAG: hypothetical protein WA867_22980, partial [Candidatus Acidiferrales bacterium]